MIMVRRLISNAFSLHEFSLSTGCFQLVVTQLVQQTRPGRGFMKDATRHKYRCSNIPDDFLIN
jgi:hypothetical protein